jgi:hypothetical protein
MTRGILEQPFLRLLAETPSPAKARSVCSGAVVLRSFTASCQRVGVDPFAWLKNVLSRIASSPITRLPELLPHNWATAQRLVQLRILAKAITVLL